MIKYYLKTSTLIFFILPSILFSDKICLKDGVCSSSNVIQILENEVHFKKFLNSKSIYINKKLISYIIIDNTRYSFDNNPSAILVNDSILTSLNQYLSARISEIDSVSTTLKNSKCDPEYTYPELVSKYDDYKLHTISSIILSSLGVAIFAGAAALNKEPYSEPYTFDETQTIEIRKFYAVPIFALSIAVFSASSVKGTISFLKMREYDRRINNCNNME